MHALRYTLWRRQALVGSRAPCTRQAGPRGDTPSTRSTAPVGRRVRPSMHRRVPCMHPRMPAPVRPSSTGIATLSSPHVHNLRLIPRNVTKSRSVAALTRHRGNDVRQVCS